MTNSKIQSNNYQHPYHPWEEWGGGELLKIKGKRIASKKDWQLIDKLKQD